MNPFLLRTVVTRCFRPIPLLRRALLGTAALLLAAALLVVTTVLGTGTALAQPRESVAGSGNTGRITSGIATDSVAHGAMVPAFVFVSLDDSSLVLHTRIDGTVYLVDFWATWCPPCVEALPELQRLYEDFHPRGFEIVSLSFDNSDERIRQFRARRFAMPWLHGRLEGGFGDIVAISFQLQNIPHYVLVGRDGRILAEGDDLHGDRLRGLLGEILGRGEE